MTLLLDPPAPAPAYRPTLDDVWRAALPNAAEIRRGRRRLHLKALFIASLTLASYWALVIADFSWYLRLGFAGVLVVALTAVGTGIMHDANHGSFSRVPWINRSLAYSMDFLGGSSWLWRFKHNHLHHGNPNVSGFDTDIDQAPFARLAPDQPWKPWHRGQHIYLWFLYGFMNLKNLLVGDFGNLATGRMGAADAQVLRDKPNRSVVTRAIIGKVVHVSWAVVIPLMFNPWKTVLLFYVVISWLVGFVLAVVFQLAHCVDAADFPAAAEARRGEDFVAFQMRTTVDIHSSAPIVGPMFRWLAGGLDHQVEHHLAPRLPHTMYPMIGERFGEMCREAGLLHRQHATIWSALCSHTRWLKAMGQPTSATATSAV